MEHDYQAIACEEKFKRFDEENRRQNHRIEKLEESITKLTELTISVEKMAVSVQTMANEIKEQGVRLAEIEKEPAEKWKKVTWIVISAIASALIGYALAKFGL